MATLVKLIALYEQYSICLRCKWRIFRKGAIGAELTSSYEIVEEKWNKFKLTLPDSCSNDVVETSAKESPVEPLTSDATTGHKMCLLCLDLLSDESLTAAKESIAKKVAEKNYHDPEVPYSLFVTLPHITVFRQASFLKFVSSCIKSNHEAKVLEDGLQLKDAFKLCLIPQLNGQLNRKQVPESPLTIHALVSSDEDASCNAMVSNFKSKSQSRKRRREGNAEKATGSAIHALIESVSTVEDMQKLFPCPPDACKTGVSFDIEIKSASVYFAGRYKKLSRQLSQTPWLIDGVRHGDTSVQELICDLIQQETGSESLKFMSSGREDVDVRMLGNGRPFAVQFINPRRSSFSLAELVAMQTAINGASNDVEVRHLQIIDKDCLSVLKDGEEHKRKHYRATVCVADGVSDEMLGQLNSGEEIEIAQRTPLRVLHRRPNTIRPRKIYAMASVRIDEKHFTLLLTTQAGTYVKEFVHGDFGRTKPSICDLLAAESDILELDVEDVELDWPPALP